MQVPSSDQGTAGIAKEEELRAGCVLCGPRMAGVGEGREWIPESPKAGRQKSPRSARGGKLALPAGGCAEGKRLLVAPPLFLHHLLCSQDTLSFLSSTHQGRVLGRLASPL